MAARGLTSWGGEHTERWQVVRRALGWGLRIGGAATLIAVGLIALLADPVSAQGPVVKIRELPSKPAAPARTSAPRPAAPRPAAPKPVARPVAPAPQPGPTSTAAAPTRRRRSVRVAQQSPVSGSTSTAGSTRRRRVRSRVAGYREETRTASERTAPDSSRGSSLDSSRSAAGSRRSRTRIARQDVESPKPEETGSRSRRSRGASAETASRRTTARSSSDDNDSAPERPTRSEPGPVALNSQAHKLQLQGRHADAEPLLRRAVEKNPSYAYAVYNLGWSLVAQGKAKQAIPVLKKATALEPDRWEPYQRLGEAYELLGDQDNAEEAYVRARELRSRERSDNSLWDPTLEHLRTALPPVAQLPFREQLSDVAWKQSTSSHEDYYFTREREQARQDAKSSRRAQADR